MKPPPRTSYPAILHEGETPEAPGCGHSGLARIETLAAVFVLAHSQVKLHLLVDLTRHGVVPEPRADRSRP